MLQNWHGTGIVTAARALQIKFVRALGAFAQWSLLMLCSPMPEVIATYHACASSMAAARITASQVQGQTEQPQPQQVYYIDQTLLVEGKYAALLHSPVDYARSAQTSEKAMGA